MKQYSDICMCDFLHQVSVWEANRGSVIRVSVPLSPLTGMPLCTGDVSMPGVDQRGAGIDGDFWPIRCANCQSFYAESGNTCYKTLYVGDTKYF